MRHLFFLMGMFAASAASAEQLSCRKDANTKAVVCYLPSSLKGNGDLRSFVILNGGPKGVDKSPYLGVVNCKAKYLELRDRKGVVFARNVPEKRHIRDFVSDVCTEHKPKPDRSLD